MSDYISREAAVKIAQEYGFVRGNFEFGHTLHSAAADWIAIKIEGLPAADVEPVRQGRWIQPSWIYYGAKQYVCDQCKNDVYWRKRILNYKEKYCPNCGAKMDLENNNGT